SKKELAENFGIQRTSLSRELNKMRKDNLIEFDSASITILDDSLI
ncbi:MAG: helix-turn-helix domain-containing protein, partial [Clostridia bacterium]|nr:helix-turn-helix domain-containing protein [Clostridia bacterium]